MRRSLAVTLVVAGGALGAAVPGLARPLLSCEETYGRGWERCGDQDSTSCYNPALGQSCCSIDNGYCTESTWCAPVAGHCCLAGEDLEACAKNAGFELPGNEMLRDLATAAAQPSTSSMSQQDL